MRGKAGSFSRNQVDVSLLLHFDGSNNSTTFTDSSSYGHSVSAVSDAVISTAQSKFGGASGFFDDTDRVDCLATNVNDFGPQDFTVEFWVRFASTSGLQILYEPSTSGQIGIYLYGGVLGVSQTGVADILGYTWSPSANTWYHLAVSRGSGTTRLWVDGTLDSTAADTENYGGGSFSVGGSSDSGHSSDGLNGYIDELRIIKNLDRYQGLASFTPSTTAFPNP